MINGRARFCTNQALAPPMKIMLNQKYLRKISTFITLDLDWHTMAYESY